MGCGVSTQQHLSLLRVRSRSRSHHPSRRPSPNSSHRFQRQRVEEEEEEEEKGVRVVSPHHTAPQRTRQRRRGTPPRPRHHTLRGHPKSFERCLQQLGQEGDSSEGDAASLLQVSKSGPSTREQVAVAVVAELSARALCMHQGQGVRGGSAASSCRFSIIREWVDSCMTRVPMVVVDEQCA